jgi:hypothetical protein
MLGHSRPGRVQRSASRHASVSRRCKIAPYRSPRYGDLMYIESEAVIGSMLTLMRDHQVPSLPVHDSLIVPASKFNVAKGASRVAWVPRQTHYSSGTGPPCFYGILDPCGKLYCGSCRRRDFITDKFLPAARGRANAAPVFFVTRAAGKRYSSVARAPVP